MSENKNLLIEEKPIRWMVWLTFIILLVLASVFYMERTLIMDASYQGFSVLSRDGFAIQVNRFGAAFVQAFPLFAARAGLPLNTVIWLYSMAFIIEPLLCVLILWFGVKNQKMGVAIVLFLTLLVSHTFYWVQSELLQAVILLLFFFGLLIKWMPLKAWHFLILFPLIPVIIFLHPLIFIPFLFLWIFTAISPSFKKNIGFYIVFIGFIATLLWKHFMVPAGAYDASSYKMAQGIIEHFWDMLDKQSTQDFIHYILTDYFFIMPLYLLNTFFYLKKKKWGKQILFQFFFWGYLSLINLSYSWGIHQFHAESFYRVLVIFLVIPLLYDVWKDAKFRKYLIYILPFIVFVRLINITARHDVYSARVHWHQELLEKIRPMEERKFVLMEKDAPPKKPEISWATPYVITMMTALEHPDSVRTVLLVDENNKNYQNFLDRKDMLLGPFGPLEFSKFKDDIFNFDTTGVYRMLTKEDLEMR
jgi:hypothetical protein